MYDVKLSSQNLFFEKDKFIVVYNTTIYTIEHGSWILFGLYNGEVYSMSIYDFNIHDSSAVDISYINGEMNITKKYYSYVI